MERVIARILDEPGNKEDPVRKFAIYNALRTLQDAKVVDPGVGALVAALRSGDATEASTAVPQTTPNFYIKRPVEALVLPSADRLVISARAELKTAFGRDFEIPQPPADLFETIEGFAERGITGFDETYYFPRLQLTEGDQLWKGRDRVKPEDYFWQQINNGSFSSDVARLEEGWYIGDRRGKPMYDNGQQRYGEDDYMEPLMAYLRDSNRIQKDDYVPDNSQYDYVPDNSRFGASPREIEEVILPEFAVMSGARGVVRNRKYIEFNVRGNMAHPQWGQTDIWEWFGDPVFRGTERLVGGSSHDGGLANVRCYPVDYRGGGGSFSPEVFFPSNPG
ncbi:MAG: hypothetical protein HYT11_04340 [Candidatus Levybacteria bacterium]|nr:hypothetical protein [Candidatus Levybacteria bacterium]